MSAISIVLFSILEKGDICLTHDGLYGGSTEVLELLSEKIGFKIIYADLNDIDYLEKIQQQNPIKLIYFESLPIHYSVALGLNRLQILQ
jgi:cystathionine beta-lyase/cystathionine gamma-synthase